MAMLLVSLTVQDNIYILFSCLLFSQDIGQMSSFYFSLGSKLDCNIFTYDYSGYGESEGRPTEKNLYSDVQAAWNALRTRYGIR